jgi:Lipocalin-like domain
MKLFRSSSIALLLTALFFTACKSKTAKELIVNKWKLTEVTGEGAKKMSDTEKNEMVGKFVMELTKDGKVTMSGMGETPKTGTYTLSEDGKTLLLTRDGDEKTEPQDINELKADKLVITSGKDQMKLTFSVK